MNTVLLKPLTYPNADRMVKFVAPANVIANDLHSIPEFHFLGRQTNLFKEVVAFDNAGPGFNLTGGHPEQVNGIHVTEGYFRVYGAPVVRGTDIHAAGGLAPRREGAGLAAIGIYGLVAYNVAQRTQEMGILMALGADRAVIRKFLVGQGMRLALVGVVAGIAASFGLTRLLSTFLFGVTPWDPAVFVSGPLILTAIALLAVWLPAARASKVDPMQALRAE